MGYRIEESPLIVWELDDETVPWLWMKVASSPFTILQLLSQFLVMMIFMPRAEERTRLRGLWSLNSLPTMMLLTCCAAVREMVMTDVSSNWLKAEISSSSR